MNRKSLANQIDILYREQKASLSAALEKASTVCCRADCWTASNRSFLGVTLYYIDEESLERRSAALVYQRLSGHHTYDVIATVLHAVFVEYKIVHKICVVITDNVSNSVKAFRVFGEAEQDENFVANNITKVLDSGSNNDSSQDIHLSRHRRCAARILNLVAPVDAENSGNNGTYREMYRFSGVLEDADLALAAAVHPKFKLS
ncbi:hypothetical protein MRX96_048154 [Rhipicephalus microplus]